MTANPITITPKETLRGVQEILGMKRIRHLPVVEGGKLVGLVSDRDMRRASPSPLSGNDADNVDAILDGTTIDRIMVKNPMTVGSTQKLQDAVKIMVEKKFGAIPVVDGGRLVGIISQIDVLRAYLKTMI
jgi:acetoin utilization protein AcuB